MTDPEDITPGTRPDLEGRDFEAPSADAVEQATSADPGYDEPTISSSIEAPEWDAYEQTLIVQMEDEYR
jgi:hypothetical protein